jgi:hypothetical protein
MGWLFTQTVAADMAEQSLGEFDKEPSPFVHHSAAQIDDARPVADGDQLAPIAPAWTLTRMSTRSPPKIMTYWESAATGMGRVIGADDKSVGIGPSLLISSRGPQAVVGTSLACLAGWPVPNCDPRLTRTDGLPYAASLSN